MLESGSLVSGGSVLAPLCVLRWWRSCICTLKSGSLVSVVGVWIKEPDTDFVEGLPESYENVNLIILDDLQDRLTEKISELFRVVSHYRNISVTLLLQNVFPKCKAMGDISLNSHYIILFKNSRDMSQINCSACRLYPLNSRFMSDAYIKATSRPYVYLVVDLHPRMDEEHRLRESLFPDMYGVHWIYRSD
ncbi:uncharacterized protein CEXT_247941 [Caerostris extrusa]|uniref:Uncharacterized protein n=1 Tax=Caerostris extrusa TaxID=172846 RepID=A0AAV4UFP5_CAEEX|nr:uncharacterized protein CEXT_247941 [Caerostris extrusa]